MINDFVEAIPQDLLDRSGSVFYSGREAFESSVPLYILGEANNRRWKSRTYLGATGISVVVASHPSIADWTARETDPSDLILRALSRRV